MARRTGIVKKFDEAKGFGFIEGFGGKDIFVHYTAIEGKGYRSLEAGERVEFDVTETDRGLQAENVARV